MKKNILTYSSNNTDNLYVLALKNDREVKIKVKDLDCHGAITTEGLAVSNTYFNSSLELYEAFERDELANGTVYIVNENGEQREYFCFNKKLTLLGQDTTTSDSLRTLAVGQTYANIDELKNDKEQGKLVETAIYTVSNKGAMQQYVLKNNKIKQISGFFNNIADGNFEEDIESNIPEDHDGIIDYNLPELENGDFRYKNHNSLKMVFCDMPSLRSAKQMFYGCPLIYFAGNLDSLENADGMFGKDCKLDYQSIVNIVDGIQDISGRLEGLPHRIDIGYSSESIEIENKKDKLADEFMTKGWQVIWWKDGAEQY